MATGIVTFAMVLCLLLNIVNAATRPNFIFIITDDQDIVFNSPDVMPSLLKYVRDDGITFNNAFVATPICCPSRTEYLSGRYFHNVRNTTDYSLNTCMHVAAPYNVINNTQNMFYMFQNNGYLTGAFGKMINNQGNFWCVDNPWTKGFSRIHSPCVENYYEETYFDKFLNGTQILHNITVSPQNYLTSYVGNNTVDFINEAITKYPDQPFMIWVGPHAPHAPATPATWYANEFNNEIAPRTPSYNVQSPDKVSWIGTNPILEGNATLNIDQQYRDRLRSLLSVDDMITAIFELLNKYPSVLDSTYVIFSSDHGFHLGQWRVGLTKHLPYDTDMRVPWYIRGPGIAKKSISNAVIGNVDLTPTILSLANIKYDENDYDGIDYSPLLLNNDNSNNRDTFLSQYMSIGTKCIKGCGAWYPSEDGSVFPGRTLSAPCYNSNNQAWMMDNTEIGNWRALRIINDSSNLMYAEWYYLENQTYWNGQIFSTPYWNELYDLDDDPYQIYNMFNDVSKQKQIEFHNLLMKYGDCKGTNCH